MSIRGVVKGAAERALIWSGAARVRRSMMSDRVLVLAYHNIVPDDAPPVGDLPNHLPLSAFAQQMAELRRTHDVIPLGEALDEPRRKSRRPRAVVTFDDAYQGAVVHGVGELARHGMPATIFVAPAFIGGKSFWWDAFAGVGEAGLDPSLRERALGELRGEDARIRAWAAEARVPWRDVPELVCAATEDQLDRAASTPGMTLGSHTWGHPNLTRIRGRELVTELEKPLVWLRERYRNTIPWIAFPYGFHDDTVMRATETAGYDAGLAISGGPYAIPAPERFALPRVNIPPGLSIRGFALRGAGLLGG